MEKTLSQDWADRLKEEFQKDYFQQLMAFLDEEYSNHTVWPKRTHVFQALEVTPYHQVKVVLLGQDPYHGPGQAHGMSFSVQPGVKIPPSLRNMYKELQEDIGCSPVNHGYLMPWAYQGVLLLNTILTVREGEAGSHKGIGWEKLTDRMIQVLNDREKPMVFVLWGSHAQAKRKWIDAKRHKVIISAHPSPLSAYRGFFGSKPYSTINKQLLDWGLDPIDWQLTND